MKPTLGKWQVIASFGRDYVSLERGWKRVELGLIKLHHLPNEGERVWKRHYRGFVLRFLIWLPIDSA